MKKAISISFLNGIREKRKKQQSKKKNCTDRILQGKKIFGPKNTIIFVTHDIEEAIYLSNKLIIFDPKNKSNLIKMNIKLSRSRHQIKTKESDEFKKYRHKLYKLIRK